MQPREAQRPSLSPRAVLAQEGVDALAALLLATGYVAQAQPLNDLAEALHARQPLLVEGPRGAGKTALAEALARGCNLDLYYLQCMEGLTLGDFLFQWDAAAQDQYVAQALRHGLSLPAARSHIWTRDFLVLGEVLAAYADPAPDGTPSVLVLDEVDKLPARNEDMLLQILARGFAHVPRLQPVSRVGLAPGQEPPIVLLTSNDLRHGVSGPLRSRCLYTWIAAPTPVEEVTILKAQVPDTDDALLGQLVKVVAYIRQMPSVADKNKPGLRETIAWLHALRRKGATQLTAAVLDRHLCYLAKQNKDRLSLRQALGALHQAAHRPHPQHDPAIREGLARFYRENRRDETPRAATV